MEISIGDEVLLWNSSTVDMYRRIVGTGKVEKIQGDYVYIRCEGNLKKISRKFLSK